MALKSAAVKTTATSKGMPFFQKKSEKVDTLEDKKDGGKPEPAKLAKGGASARAEKADIKEDTKERRMTSKSRK